MDVVVLQHRAFVRERIKYRRANPRAVQSKVRGTEVI